jgi:anti-sigma factor RsiW
VRALSCKELVELITDYLEGALPRRARKRFERHLEECDGCRAYLESMRRTIRVAGVVAEDQIPEPVRGELLAAFRDWNAAR